MRLGGAVDLLRFRWKQNFVDLADHARDERQWELAAQLYRKALGRNPRNMGIWVQYGHALKESGQLRDPDRLAQAELAYRKALSLEPRAADTHLQLGHVLKLQDKIEEAQAAYLRALALEPAMSHPVQELGKLGWSEAQQAELRRLVLADADSEDGAAAVRSPQSASAELPSVSTQVAGDPDRLRARAAYSISQIDVHSFPAGYATSADVAMGGALSEARLDDQTARIVLPDNAVNVIGVGVPPGDQTEVLRAIILAQRWNLDGVNEQLREVVTENEQLKARVTALEPKDRDLPRACCAAGAPPRSKHSDPCHRSDADNPRPQMDETTPRGEIDSIDQDLRLLFDPEYYRAQAAARGLVVDDPLTHFDEVGGRQGVSPHPLFDAAYYLDANSDVKCGRDNPLRHYLMHGDKENRNPHRLFNTSYYKSRAGISSDNGLLHYVRIGGRSIDPHECFDTKYYLSKIGCILPMRMSALEFYLTDNHGMSVSPHPLFDQAYYASQLAEAERRHGPLLLHYLAQPPDAAASPHPLFDLEFFHDGHGYSQPALQFYLSIFRAMASGGYQLHKMQFPEANQYFCSISYLLDHPDLLDGANVPMAHFARRKAGVRRILGLGHSRDDQTQLEEKRTPSDYEPIQHMGGEFINLARSQVNDVSYLDKKAEILSTARDGDANLAALFEHTLPWATSTLKADRLVDVATQRRRVAVYAVFVPDGRVKTYHKMMLRALRQARYPTIVVNSTMAAADNVLHQVGELVDGVIVRRGHGRDFASWVIALAHIAPALVNVDHLLLLNDSLIGPFRKVEPVIKSMEDDPADFKGLTESNEVAHHLQSSLLMLSRNAIFSAPFLTFLLRFIPGATRKQVIEDGEVGLSQRMIAAGVTASAQVSYTAIIQSWLEEFPEYVAWAHALPEQLEQSGLYRLFRRDVAARFGRYAEEWLLAMHPRIWSSGVLNPQQICWEPLLRHGSFPFLKKDLVTRNPERIPTLARICNLFPPEQRFDAAELLRDLSEAADGFPTSYLRLSPALIDAMVN